MLFYETTVEFTGHHNYHKISVYILSYFSSFEMQEIVLSVLIAFDEGERKPNFVFVSCVFRVGVPVYAYAEFFEIA